MSPKKGLLQAACEETARRPYIEGRFVHVSELGAKLFCRLCKAVLSLTDHYRIGSDTVSEWIGINMIGFEWIWIRNFYEGRTRSQHPIVNQPTNHAKCTYATGLSLSSSGIYKFFSFRSVVFLLIDRKTTNRKGSTSGRFAVTSCHCQKGHSSDRCTVCGIIKTIDSKTWPRSLD